MEDPYTPPQSDLDRKKSGPDAIAEFPRFSAWAVFGLLIITLGIYSVYWLYSRTNILNRITSQPIPSSFTSFVLVGYVMVFAIAFASGMSPDDESLAIVSTLLSFIINISMLVWFFKIKNRINDLTATSRGDALWIGPILTFLFNTIYLQYKINQIIDGES